MFVVAEADRQRKAEGLSHQDFARELGVSPSLWSLTLSGKKPLDRKLGNALKRKFPTMATLVEMEVGKSRLSR